MLLRGDCISVMKAIKPNSVDAIVCDPPYNLHFMGKDWDKDLLHEKWLTKAYRVLKPGGSMLVMGGTRTSHRLACAIEDSGFIIKDTLTWLYGSGFPKAQDLGKMIDKRRNWCSPDKFAELIKRKRLEKNISITQMDKDVCSGTTNYSWLEGRPSGIRLPQLKEYQKIKKILGLDNKWDSYFEEAEREIIGKHQSGLGSGKTYAFTERNINADKDLDETSPSTDLAKHWDGFKVGGIKPAYEPIIWAVKPPEGSYVDNVLKWGVGAVNVDECRIEWDDAGLEGDTNRRKSPRTDITGGSYGKAAGARPGEYNGDAKSPKGRFPANVILDEEAGKLLDEQSGNLTSGANPERRRSAKTKTCYGEFEGQKNCISYRGKDSGGASRFFYCAKASRGERNAGLDGMEKKECFNLGHKDNPGRNAPKKSYPRQNNHPTVKPIKLFEYLIKLVTREGQIVLDPFMGSGTTAIAAHNVGRKCVGIEKEDEYLTIAKRRIDYWKSQPQQMEMRI